MKYFIHPPMKVERIVSSETSEITKENFRFSQRDQCFRKRIVLNSYNEIYCSFSFVFSTAIEIINTEIIILD